MQNNQLSTISSVEPKVALIKEPHSKTIDQKPGRNSKLKCKQQTSVDADNHNKERAQVNQLGERDRIGSIT
jgi:hypothetical protein